MKLSLFFSFSLLLQKFRSPSLSTVDLTGVRLSFQQTDDIIQPPNSSVMITPYCRSSKMTLSCKKRGRDRDTPKDDEVLPQAPLMDWGSKVRQ